MRRDGRVAGGDGQVTLGNTVLKHNARKVRRLYKDQVLAGFAGGSADAFTLFDRVDQVRHGQDRSHPVHQPVHPVAPRRLETAPASPM